jgi:hypothetical protein
MESWPIGREYGLPLLTDENRTENVVRCTRRKRKNMKMKKVSNIYILLRILTLLFLFFSEESRYVFACYSEKPTSVQILTVASNGGVPMDVSTGQVFVGMKTNQSSTLDIAVRYSSLSAINSGSNAANLIFQKGSVTLPPFQGTVGTSVETSPGSGVWNVTVSFANVLISEPGDWQVQFQVVPCDPSSTETSVSQPPIPFRISCDYSISLPTNPNVPVTEILLPTSASSQTVSVTASSSSCSYQLVLKNQDGSVPTWISFSSTGQVVDTTNLLTGSQSVPFFFTANNGSTERIVILSVNDGNSPSVTIRQSPPPPPCVYGLSASSMNFPQAGGPGSVTITVTSGTSCSWTATSNASWITITAGSGPVAGNGTVNYSVAVNSTGVPRTGTLTIAGQTVTVNQDGPCIYVLSETSHNFVQTGGNASITVTVTSGSGCSWTATSNASWITITAGSGPVAGNGTVNYSVAVNSTGVPRTGTLTIAGQRVTVNQDGPCIYVLSETSHNFVQTGGNASITVTVTSGSGCSWTATSNASWITITAGSGPVAGNGTVNYSVAVNSTGAPRTGTLTIAGQRVTVNQDGPCSFVLSETSHSFGQVGGNASITVTVTSGSGCSWTATSNASWITITGGSGPATGNGTVNYSVAVNSTGVPRTGTLTIAGQTVTVNQDGPCIYVLSETSHSFGQVGGNASITVTVTSGTGCSWTATSNASWITITGGSGPVAGNGTVNYSVAVNSTGAPRTGTLTIAGQTYTVSQDGPCSYVLSGTSHSFGQTGGNASVTVTVTSGTGCSWTATSNASWITITGGSGPVAGNGTVNYSVAVNSTGAPRTGTLTIAGQTVTVNQDGPCIYVLSETSHSFGQAGGNASITVTVTSGTGCSWTATSNASWITITSGSGPATGNGTVSYSVATNSTGAPRTGTLTIAGQTNTVSQESCSFSITGPNEPLAASGGSSQISVISTSTCPWTLEADRDWIIFPNGSSGTGSGSIVFSVNPNETESERTGHIKVSGTVVMWTVVQGFLPCSYSISPGGMTLPSNAPGGKVQVTTPRSSCPWTINSDQNWLVFDTGSSKSGSGVSEISFSFTEPNTTGKPREAHLTIPGSDAAATITQDAAVITFYAPVFLYPVKSPAGATNSTNVLITNRGDTEYSLEFVYKKDSSDPGLDVVDPAPLPQGQQRVILDLKSYLLNLGADRASEELSPGLLQLKIKGIRSPNEAAVLVKNVSNQESGSVGWVFRGISKDEALIKTSYVIGLRENTKESSSLVVMNVGDEKDGNLQITPTLFSGDHQGPPPDDLTDIQLATGEIFVLDHVLNSASDPLSQGYLRMVQPPSTFNPYYAFVLIYDSTTGDGSLIAPVDDDHLKAGTLNLPEVVQNQKYTSERLAFNPSTLTTIVNFSYSAPNLQVPVTSGMDRNIAFRREFNGEEQVIVPDLISYLREHGFSLALPSGIDFAGPLGASSSDGRFYLGVRNSAVWQDGKVGGMLPVNFRSEIPSDQAWVYGLLQDANNHCNLGIVNYGASTSIFTIGIYDGATGEKVLTLENVSVEAGQLKIFEKVLATSGLSISQGYLHVTQTQGGNPFQAYGALYDGADSTSGSGDVSYLESRP